MKHQTCLGCGHEYPATAEHFHSRGPAKGGLHKRCKRCRSEEAKRYNSLNGEHRRAKGRAYYSENRERESERGKLKYFRNRASVLERCAKRYQSKKEEIQQRRRARLRSDPILRLNKNVGRVMNLCLVEGKCGVSWKRLVNYSVDDLKEHLESLFGEGMSWSNYGRSSGAKRWWTVDHKRPIDSFSITSVYCSDFKACWSLKNLQPMWSDENFGKGAKYER